MLKSIISLSEFEYNEMRMRPNLLLLMFLMVVPLSVIAFDEVTSEQLEKWFEDDEQDHPFDRKSDGGTLVFLQAPPLKQAPQSSNILTIRSQSLETGWVAIDQCHAQLDPIHRVEVVYQYQAMRNLRITETSGIRRAWVEGQSVQLEGVQQGARLCVQAEAKILYRQDDKHYLLRNGPFQRRFLDSYFPMHLSLTIRYPDDLLSFQGISPAATGGFNISPEKGAIRVDTWFEGKLLIEFEFKSVL